MSNIVLPKKTKEGYYLSNSQVTKWHNDRRGYIRQYIYGEPFDGNDYTRFGNKVGKALEKGVYRGFTAEEKKFLATIPRYDEFEKHVKLEMDGFFIKGYIDTNTFDGKLLADYKTGSIDTKTPYYSSDQYFQLDLYAEALRS